MKKTTAVIFTLLLLLGLGTGAMAKSEDIACALRDFKEMLPMMQEKHPELDKKELKAMYDDCAKNKDGKKSEPAVPQEHCKVKQEQ